MQAAAPNGDTEILPGTPSSPITILPDHRHDLMRGGMRALRVIDMGPDADQRGQMAAALHDNAAIRLEPDVRRMDHGGPVHQGLRDLFPRIRLRAQFRLDHVQAISVNNATPKLARSPNGIIMKDPNGNFAFTVNFTI